jgi:hypothetical protein
MATTLTVTVVQQVAGGELIVRSSNQPSFVCDVPAGEKQSQTIANALKGLIQQVLAVT